MQALLTVNIFSQWTPVALIGVGLFGALLALPLFCKPDERPGSDGTVCHHSPH